MTLVVGAQNMQYALQVSDRRLTDETGAAVDEESNKLFIFQSDACRFVVGFTGLAGFSGAGAFETNKWLCEALRDAGPPDYNPNLIIQRLRDECTRRFSMPAVLRLSPFARRLSIMLTGFVFSVNGPLPAYCLITNYQDFEHGVDHDSAWPAFLMRVVVLSNPRSQWAVQRVGYPRHFGSPQVCLLSRIVATEKPSDAAIGKTVEMIRSIAGAPGSISPVGRQLMSSIMPLSGGVMFGLSLARFPGHTYSVGEEPTARYNGKATPLLQ